MMTEQEMAEAVKELHPIIGMAIPAHTRADVVCNTMIALIAGTIVHQAGSDEEAAEMAREFAELLLYLIAREVASDGVVGHA